MTSQQRPQRPHPPQRPVQDECRIFGTKPQLFVQLSFGVSWSDRHIPQTHTISYTSKSLKTARTSGHFPRQDPSHHQHRRHDASQLQHRDDWRPYRADHDRQRGRPCGNSRSRHPGPPPPPGNSRLEDPRGATNERGSSAPPPIHNSAWDDEEGGPSATLFPRPGRTTTAPSHAQKILPANPASFRLGEDGLPWSVPAWPYDSEGNDDIDSEQSHAALTTTAISPSPPGRRHREDSVRARELASLSTAMVTVDNGFENQWWNQGQRESIARLPLEDPEDDIRPMSMADAALLSAAEPYSPNSEGTHNLVSPLSDFGPNFDYPRALHRSTSIRSDELWMGS
ncbi:hypothetical protein F4861DRAFT_66675 [Xylaria intraflava]|nr:hypothetical protein F4861DRAFT_66675 [Xylaria intraflava]